ncbi:stress-induced protein SAM22 [Cajanus cajan]|uniref:Stress-induced protein SAM22 n=1 Tax=Cajanus cajan TaxID=3821 RepID=A0A151QWT2_CAJCA|nr:stress-induced protein SAM22 [Cajanus cajan]KYP34817.1 Stress-induced protein SAM22 [Cajanus cajan]
MGVFSFEDETTSPVAPAKLYKALVNDADNLIPKVVEAVKSVEIVEGNGGPGTIKKLTIVEEGETKHVLHKVEGIDEANFGYSYSIVGGVALPDTVEKITFESKFIAGPNGGSVAKLSVKFQTKGDAKPNEEELKTGKAKGNALFKAIEGYLLANPHY